MFFHDFIARLTTVIAEGEKDIPIVFTSVQKCIEKFTDLDTDFAFFIEFPQKTIKTPLFLKVFHCFFSLAHLQFFDNVRAPS